MLLGATLDAATVGGLDVRPLAAAAAVAVVLVAGPWWRAVRIGVTGVHELGHALAGLVVGARVTGIRLHLDTSGRTDWSYAGDPGRLRRAWVAWWGYPTPPLVGAGVAWALTAGHARAFATVAAVAAVAVLVVWVRNAWGALVTLAAAGVLGVAAWLGTAAAGAAAAAVAVVLLAGGLRTTLEHLGRRRHDPGADSRQVARGLLVVPAVVVRVAFVAVAAVAVGWSVGHVAAAAS